MGVALFSALFSLAPSAAAFCRSNSCDPSRGEDCFRDAQNCLQGGLLLAWRSACTTFAVQRDGSVKHGIDATTFESVIRSAFDTWQKADCGEGTTPSIRVEGFGLVECDQVLFNKDQGNANVFMFRDDEWLGRDPARVYALTTTQYDWKTGEIYDVDMEINGTMANITNGAPEEGADLPSIITHETGHFLGLDHSEIREATMYFEYTAGARSLRELAQDDVDGICAVYPPDREIRTDSCDPRRGFQSSCRHDIDDGCGCRIGPGAPRSNHGVLLLMALGAGLAARRRRAERVKLHQRDR